MRPRFALAVFYFAFFGALGSFWPFLAAYLTHLGLQPSEIGALHALLPLGTLVAPPLVGLAADLLRARVWLLRTLSVAAAVAFAAFIQAGAGRLALVVAAVVFAVARAPLAPMADAATVEHTRRHGGSYGVVRLWGSVGFLLASLAGGVIVDLYGTRAVMLLSLGALGAAAAASWALPAPPPRAERGALRATGRLLRRGDLWLFLAVVALGQMAHAAYDAGFSLHLARLGFGGRFTGLAWATGVVAEVALLAGSGALLRRFGAERLLAVALAVAAARWLLLIEARHALTILALQPLHAVSFGLFYVAGVTVTREQATAETQTAAQGLFSAAFALGSVLGMPLAGQLLARWGSTTMFGTAAVIAGCAGGCAVWHARRAAARAGSRCEADAGAPPAGGARRAAGRG